MSATATDTILADWAGARPLGDRIKAAEEAVDLILRTHRVKFAINVVTVDGRAIHQEIVLVDQKD